MTSFFDYCCYGNQLDTTWSRLIESANEVFYMYKISSQIVSKVEERFSPSRLRVTIFSLRRLGLNLGHFLGSRSYKKF